MPSFPLEDRWLGGRVKGVVEGGFEVKRGKRSGSVGDDGRGVQGGVEGVIECRANQGGAVVRRKLGVDEDRNGAWQSLFLFSLAAPGRLSRQPISHTKLSQRVYSVGGEA